MTASYNIMTWKKYNISKYKDFEPIELSQVELKTAIAIIATTKSIESQREIVVELMFTLTPESFSELYKALDPELIKKIMPEC